MFCVYILSFSWICFRNPQRVCECWCHPHCYMVMFVNYVVMHKVHLPYAYTLVSFACENMLGECSLVLCVCLCLQKHSRCWTPPVVALSPGPDVEPNSPSGLLGIPKMVEQMLNHSQNGQIHMIYFRSKLILFWTTLDTLAPMDWLLWYSNVTLSPT